MTEQTAITFIEQYMRSIGKTKTQYYIEPVYFNSHHFSKDARGITFLELKAQNQLYVLVNNDKYFGFEIIADNNYFHANIYSLNSGEHFTGNIRIERIEDHWTIEPRNTGSSGGISGNSGSNSGNNGSNTGGQNPSARPYIAFIRAIIY